jgi:hypothetical protein
MNCQNFYERMNDVARGALIDATTRAEALAHQAACAACAARLADDRTLSAGLRALAARDAGVEAPPRVEAALLAAFRARRAAHAVAQDKNVDAAAPQTIAASHVEAPAAVGAMPPRSNVASLDDARALRHWTWRKSLATAATAATAAAAAIALMIIIGPGDAPSKLGSRSVAEVASPMVGPQTAAVIDSPRAASLASEARRDERNEAAEPSTADVRAEMAGLSSRRELSTQLPRPAIGGRAAMMRAKYERGGSAGRARRGAMPVAEAGGEEYATDFIPLYQAEQAAPVVTGQLVRVELPRSALSRFGLTVNSEGGAERVKADVLLGEDGMARAIRFVR